MNGNYSLVQIAQFIRSSEPDYRADVDYSCTVIVPVNNGFQHLKQLIPLLERNTLSCTGIIFVNDCSTDENVYKLLKQATSVHNNWQYIENQSNPGFARSVNIAMNEVTTKYAILINPDTKVPKRWVERMITPFLERPNIASTTPFTNSGMVFSFPEFICDNRLEGTVEEYDKAFELLTYDEYGLNEVYSGMGFCMGINMECWEKIGPFDIESFGRGFREEEDWCFRALDAGYKNLLVPNLFVEHSNGGSFSKQEKGEFSFEHESILSEKLFLQSDPWEIYRNAASLLLFKDGCHLFIDLKNESSNPSGAFDYSQYTLNKLAKNENIIVLQYLSGRSCWELVLYSKFPKIVIRLNDISELPVLFSIIKVERITINNLAFCADIEKAIYTLLNIKSHCNYSFHMSYAFHDYLSVCPSFFLIDNNNYPCNPGDIVYCERCIKQNDARAVQRITIHRWRHMFKSLFSEIDEFYLFSYYSKATVLKIYPEIENRVKVLYHEPLIDINSKKFSQPKQIEDIRIAFVGSYQMVKGSFYFEDLIETFIMNGIPASFYLAGTVFTDVVHHSIINLGPYNRNDLGKILSDAKINLVVCPSIANETFSYVCQELMILNVPFVVFPNGAPQERIKREKYQYGEIANDVSVESLCDSTIKLLKRLCTDEVDYQFSPLIKEEILSIDTAKLIYQKKYTGSKKTPLLSIRKNAYDSANYEEINRIVRDLTNEKEALQKVNDEINEQYNSLQNEYGSLLDRYENLLRECDNANIRYHNLQMEFDEINGVYRHLQEDYEVITDRYNLLQGQYAQKKLEYDTISNAFFWKISGPARGALDFIKDKNRDNPGFQLIGKGLKCLEENGPVYTARRVITKVKIGDVETIMNEGRAAGKQIHVGLLTAGPYDPSDYLNKESLSIDIVVPIYNGMELLPPLLESIPRTKLPYHLYLVDDHSTDKNVIPCLKKYAAIHENVTVLRNKENLGYTRTINRVIASRCKGHVVLLNTDVRLPMYWLERLMWPIFSDKSVATVTPFTNSGELCSFPIFLQNNELYRGLSVDEIDKAFQALLPHYTSLPTGVGFCMAMSRHAINKIGLYDEKAFPRGYGEENDWCQRAEKAGFRNVIAENLFVYHQHGGSFTSEEKQELLKTNYNKLCKKHPNYEGDIHRFFSKDPLEEYRSAAEFLLWKRDTLLAVTFEWGGGAAIFLEKKIEDLIKSGRDVLTLKYCIRGEYELTHHWDNNEKSLCSKDLAEIFHYLSLRPGYVSEVWVNELVTYPAPFLLHKLLLPFTKQEQATLTYFVHDYYSVCPSYTLLDENGSFCGVPDSKKCNERCPGRNEIVSWRSNWNEFLLECSEVRTFSDNSARLMKSAYPDLNNITIVPHKVEYLRKVKIAENRNQFTIGVIGAINSVKGLDILKEMSVLIKKDRLPIHIIIIGYPSHEFVQSDTFSYTGKYEREQLPDIIEQKEVDLIFISSILPETFSYTTSEAIMMGLPVASFDLGAPADRVRDYDKGLVISEINAEVALREIYHFLTNSRIH